MILRLRTALLGLVAFTGTSTAQLAISPHPIPMTYCASLNTGQTTENSSIYQSDGLCRTFCLSSWALAIVKGDTCWCSNYVPDQAQQVSIDKCDYACPGFPNDTCGSPDYWGYIGLTVLPSGTTTAGSTAGASSTSGHSMTPTPSAVQTVTVGGQPSTVFVTPTPNSVSTGSTGSKSSSGGVSKGAAAGIAIGVVAGVGLFVAALFLFWRRRKMQEDQAAASPDDPSQRGSSAGMMYGARTDMTEAGRYAAAAADARSTESSEKSQRRRSHLMPMDPRLDPYSAGTMYANKSHESINTLRDDQDYSRRVHEPPKVLRATNPDPDLE